MAWHRLRLRAAIAVNVVQIPAKANSERSSLSANQTTSFFFVSGFGSGAYSAKLLAGTKHRFSGFSQPRQCGDDVAGAMPVLQPRLPRHVSDGRAHPGDAVAGGCRTRFHIKRGKVDFV